MTIKYNNKVIAGKYREQVIPFANTIDAGIAKIATQEQINEGTDNTSIVTPVYLAQKQDKLTAGEGIDIDATNTISSKVLPDKVTIVENDNKTLSTVARKTINEKLVFDWEGTEAEYHQAIMNGEIDPDWYCYITDDELSVSYNDVLSRTLVNIAPDGVKVLGASNAYLTNDVYIDEAGYNQLLELKNSATQVDNKDNITVNGVLVEIPYVLTHTGSKITDAKYRDILVDFYNENGYTNYFTIDEENKNYTLPMGEIYGKLVDKDLSDISEIAKDIIKDIAGVSFSLFDTKIADHELSLEESLGWALQGTYVYKEAITGERFGYPTFYERCIEEKNAGTAKSVTLGSNTITMYINDNGHQFYNIADKSIVDTYYTSFGIADFYGIDEENECIFLPRNKWFMQLTDDTANVNKFTDAGLPSHTHTFTRPRGDQNYGNGSGNSWWGATNGVTVTTSTPNNSIYGKSNTVQPKSSSKLLYYCVGNTKADTSWVNVFAQVEEGIKEIYDTKAEVLEEVNTLRETSANEIGTLKQDSINEIDTLRATSVNEISTLNTGSLNQIEALKDKSISEINVLKTNSTNEINTLRLESVSEIDTLKQESVSEIDTLKKDSIDEMEDKRVSSNESITTTKEESIEELLDITTDKIQEVKSWSIGTEEERPEGSAKYWAEVAELSSSNALFDTKISDHILKGSEAYGWELQGTYVYKDAVFGEHLGYQDFYFKCLEEYTNPTNEKIYLNSNINTIGSLVNNNGILSGFSVDNYAVLPNVLSIYQGENFDIVINFTTGTDITTNQNIFSSCSMGGYSLALNIASSKISLYLSSTGTSWDLAKALLGTTTLIENTAYTVKLTFNGEKYECYLSQNEEDLTLECVIESTSLLASTTDLPRLGMYNTKVLFNGSINLKECYININGERWWSGVNYITKNLNGHKYYNIKIKNVIDNFYNQYGIADFYGIDETNERVLLPRNKYFHQLTLDTNEVNNMVEAGLPNITGTFALGDVSDTYTAYTNHLQYGDGAFYSDTQSTASYNESGQSTKGNIPKFDASRSNSIYGNSDTVQPQSSLKLLYYCVGNTKADTSWIKLVEQVENGIKDIEDKRVESIKDVDNLRIESINQIDTLRVDSVEEVDTLRLNSVNEVDTLRNQSVEEINTLKTNSVNEIIDTKNNSLQEIDTLRINSINEIDTLKENSIEEVDILRQNSVQEVTYTKNDSVKEVEDTTLKGLHSLAGASNTLTHNQITNCLLEVPQRIKHTLENGTLTIKAGSVIIVPYGIEDLTSQYPIGSIFLNENYKVYDTQFEDSKFFVWVELQSNLVVNANLTNADRYIFYNFSLNNMTSAVTHNASSGETTPSNNGLWYDTANNLVYYYYSSTQEKQISSLPLGVFTTSTETIEKLKYIYNGLGYIGSTVWVDKDVKCLVPDGRSLDGTFNNIVYQTNEFKTFTRQLTKNDVWIMLGPDGFVTSHTFEYNEDLNRIQNTGTDNYVSYACIGLVDMNKGLISNFKPKNTFHTIDYNDLKEVHCIIETYKSGASWYRIWSDGWIEQGGNFGTAFSSWTAKTITFLKPFSDVYYYVSPITGHTANTDSPCINAKTVKAFSCTVYNSTGNACWYACGY